MKLELKHLSPYVPYKLNAIRDNIVIETGLSNFISFWHLDNFKPILRQLSDLTKEIEIINGEKFIPMVELLKMQHKISLVREDINFSYSSEFLSISPISLSDIRTTLNIRNLSYNNYWKIEKLLEWHFDIFGLIDAGLAVDINTVAS